MKLFHTICISIALASAMTAVGQGRAQPPSANSPASEPEIQLQAAAMLKAISERLAAAKTITFTAVSTYKSPATNGQPLYYATISQVTMQRPNKLRVITPGDGPPTEFYYDGKRMIAFDPGMDLAAVATHLPPSTRWRKRPTTKLPSISPSSISLWLTRTKTWPRASNRPSWSGDRMSSAVS